MAMGRANYWDGILTTQKLFVCILLIFVLSIQVPTASTESDNVPRENSSCTEDLRQRRERLEKFKFTFADPRQVMLFKYVSARATGRRIPSSAIHAISLEFANFNQIIEAIGSLGRLRAETYSECFPHHGESNQQSREICASIEIRLMSEYRENFQKFRDLLIDCWNSQGLIYFLDENTTVLPLEKPNNTMSWTACNKVFEKSENYSEYHIEVPTKYSKIVDECDYREWQSLHRYEFICKRSALETSNEDLLDEIHDIEDKIDILLNFPYENLDPTGIFHVRTGKLMVNEAEDLPFFKTIQPGFDVIELPLYRSFFANIKMISHFITKLTFNTTEELRSRGMNLYRNIILEMQHNNQTQSELSAYYTEIPYIFNAETENITLLEFAKVTGRNYRFKYVYMLDGNAYEVNMNNDKIFGKFVTNPELPVNLNVERIKRLLNKIIKFYWDIMATRGIHPQPPSDEDYAVTCNYELVSKFRKFDHTLDVIRTEHIERNKFQRLPKLLQIIHKLSNSPNVTNELLQAADKYTRLLRLAYNTFKNVDQSQFEINVYMLIGDLLIEFLQMEEIPTFVILPEFFLEEGFFLECKSEPRCYFLLTLKLMGSHLDLPYLNESGEEILIDNTGIFTYIPRDGDEPPEIGRIRRLMNTIAAYSFELWSSMVKVD